uniref:Uncharacterized protein n=1 Tax=Glossina pallidipes TaxID=7398 RepID=A0A1A9ZQU8_GLOPL
MQQIDKTHGEFRLPEKNILNFGGNWDFELAIPLISGNGRQSPRSLVFFSKTGFSSDKNWYVSYPAAIEQRRDAIGLLKGVVEKSSNIISTIVLLLLSPRALSGASILFTSFIITSTLLQHSINFVSEI